MTMGNPYGPDNMRRMAEDFSGVMNTGQRNSSGGDANRNGVPDREEMTLKVSRPANRNTPTAQPVNQPFAPTGLNTGNMQNFLRTPAGGEMMRRIVGRVNPNAMPQGLSADRIMSILSRMTSQNQGNPSPRS